MSSKKQQLYLLSLIVFLSYGPLNAQTSHWHLIWDKNADDDSVEYYVVYKHSGSVPSSRDSIAGVDHPASQNQDSVMYIDTELDPGILYYYSVVAVDYLKRRSVFSEPAFEAIPTIINFPDTLKLPADTSVVINLTTRVSDLDDPSSELSWFVNGQKSYHDAVNSLNISINTSNRASFVTNSVWSDTLTVQFSTVDPDSFYNIHSLVLTSGVFSTDTTDTTLPPPVVEEEQIYAFPVPFISDQHNQITIDKIPENADLVIYNFITEPVFYYKNITGGEFNWDVRNMTGKNISSGLYFYIIKDKNGNKIASGKLVVIR
jgi:hypothetical protein